MPITGKFDPLLFGDSTQFDIKGEYTTELLETVTLSGSVDRKYNSKRTILEGAQEALFDPVLFGDSDQFHITNSSTLTAIDSVTSIHGIVRGITESSIVINDVIERLVAFKRTAVETITNSDTITRIQEHVRSIVEPAYQMFDDLLFGDSTQFDVQTQTTSVSDTLTRQSGQTRPISETVTSSGTVGRVLTSFRTISNTVLSSDSVDRITSFFRTISDDAISISQSIQRTYGSVRENIETTTISGTVDRLATMSAIILETVISSESVTRVRATFRTISDDAVSITDQVVRQWTQNRIITETSVIVSDSIATLKARLRVAIAYLAKYTGIGVLSSRSSNVYLTKRDDSDVDMT